VEIPWDEIGQSQAAIGWERKKCSMDNLCHYTSQWKIQRHFHPNYQSVCSAA